ncbi:MAG TPA: hypothetical protein VND89_09405 [Acidimicrobiales bacterium]|nr:hypothetical protein [Acidimicrobiales bacterium]
MTTSDITIIGTAKDVLTVSDPLIVYRPVEVKGDRYIIDLQAPEPPKNK